MILNTTPTNQVISSTSSIGEFTIKASPKSFQILSNSLYKYKIRAIIRELSTNAYDAHVEAGKPHEPFFVHFPTMLEPYFAIQDFGTGISYKNIKDVFTVYFESTKTNSNDFVGVLGLGCKSPYSYTDNFTIISIQHGIKYVYTAFINDSGVPDITLLYEDQTSDSNGLTIQFAVHDSNDFYKFTSEAKEIYAYFPIIPNTNLSDFAPIQIEYSHKDIITGGHITPNYTPVAIMGMIRYSIEELRYENEFNNFSHILHSGVELHFPIGSLDIQPSREGLSYIPSTTQTIKEKLTEFNNALVNKIEEEVSNIDNVWERSIYLNNKLISNRTLWGAIIKSYCLKHDFSFLNKNLSFYKADLAEKYNIDIKTFIKVIGRRGVNIIHDHKNLIDITVTDRIHFIINDLKTGAFSRAKYHWNNQTTHKDYSYTVFVLDACDHTKTMDHDSFFNDIFNPPERLITNASQLLDKPKKNRTYNKEVSILKLSKNYKGELTWIDCKLSAMSNDIHYYVELSGYKMNSKYGFTNAKTLFNMVDSCSNSIKLEVDNIYGVRKNDLKQVRSLTNWYNYEDYIVEQLNNIPEDNIKYIAWKSIDSKPSLNPYVANLVPISFYNELYDEIKEIKSISYYSLLALSKKITPHLNTHIEDLTEKYTKMINKFNELYPLLQFTCGTIPTNNIVDYIMLIDSTRKNT